MTAAAPASGRIGIFELLEMKRVVSDLVLTRAGDAKFSNAVQPFLRFPSRLLRQQRR
jgi:hypothetical protein